MNQYKFLAPVMAAIPLLIAGCGGGSSDGGVVNTPVAPQTKTITVMDGYLHNATVCIDLDRNGVCSLSEELSTSTNEVGQVVISLENAKYPIIAKANAGVTYDSDRLSVLTKSYELIAAAGSDHITPFTTLAYLNAMPVEDLAVKFGLKHDAITADYVKNIDIESQFSHLIARSVTFALASKVVANDIEALNSDVEQIVTRAKEMLNQKLDLTFIDITYNSLLGEFYPQPKDTHIDSYLAGKSFIKTTFSNHHIINGNDYDELVSFNDGVISYRGRDLEYKLNHNTLAYGDGSFTFVVMNEKFAFSFSEYKEPAIWTKSSISSNGKVNIDDSFFSGKTLYHLRDINTSDESKALPKLTELRFNTEDQVVVTPEGEEGFVSSWEVKDWVDHNGDVYRVILIEFPQSQRNRASLKEENAMILEMRLMSDEISIVKNHSTLTLVRENLIFSDEKLAKLFFESWQN
jgi:ethanolamine utilization microcompartment shell protein EutS